jgi:hypothetical protein
MKVSITVDCSAEEARRFFGMPDLQPLQEAMLAQMQSQMKGAAAAMDPETLFKTLFPMQPDAFAGMQKAFWNQFTGGTSGGKSGDER